MTHLLHNEASRRPWVPIIIAMLAWTIGCGPIQSTQQINEARASLERARVDSAYERAPYKYFRARYYLHKAKETWGYSEFQASYEYAKEATQAAEAAIRRSEEDPWSDPIPSRGRTYELNPNETITIERAKRELDRLESRPDETSEGSRRDRDNETSD